MTTARYKDAAELVGINPPSSTSVRATQDPYEPRPRTKFTKDAVKITIPSNPPLTHSYNPYSRMSSRSSPKGNRSTEAQTVFRNLRPPVSDASVPPPMKKRRVEEESSVREIGTKKPTLFPSLPCATGEDDKDPIDVISDEEYERRVPVVRTNHIRWEAQQPLERAPLQKKSAEEVSAFRSVRDPADDLVNEGPLNPPNPSSSSSAPTQSIPGGGITPGLTTSSYFPPKPSGNNVSSLSRAYEIRESTSGSSRSKGLAAFNPTKKKLTNSMQPKAMVADRPVGLTNGRHGANSDAIATKTSHFQGTNATNQRLPLRAAIIGPQLFTSDWDNEYWLYFTHNLLTLRRFSAGDEVILLKQPLNEVCDLKATLQRETEKTYMLGVKSNCAMLTLEGDEQRALRSASFTFMLDQSRSGWNLGIYKTFLRLAYPKGPDLVTSDAADSIWQHEIENHRRSSGRRCSSPPPPQQLPNLGVAHRIKTIGDDRVHVDDYSMTPLRQTRSKSVGTHTASGNPSRLKPRPRPRPKTTALKSPSPQLREPEPDPDEIILVYPPAATGAVNITNSVIRRLQPGEFLNDTLIEFGLKLWLHRLRQENPALADEIHIFSSFFYKKLKSTKDGYKSVRKWTARFDVFKKKFLIVPINENVHWYLAIICYPEHSLLEPLAQNTVKRKSPRKAVVEKEETIVLNAPSPELQYPLAHAESSTEADSAPTEVAGLLSEVDGVVESTRNVSLNDDVRMTSPEREESPELQYPAQNTDTHVAGKMEMDGAVVATSRESSPLTELESNPEAEIDDKKVLQSEAEELESKKPLQTMVFTLDSMGSKHLQVVRNLAKYLENEAMDKKSIKQTRKASGERIEVPFQPNFCDCGIYLLHFARTFMQNTEKTYMFMTNQKKGKSVDEEDFWQGDAIKDFRNTLLQEIETLSREWKANQVTKDADDNIAKESSTSDVDNRRSEEDPLQSDKEVEKMTSTVVPASEEDDDVEIVQVVQTRKRRSRRG